MRGGVNGSYISRLFWASYVCVSEKIFSGLKHHGNLVLGGWYMSHCM